jgi:hypothetical protein
MKIPLKPSLLKIRRKRPRWIIIHHTSEIYEIPEARIDNSKYQLHSIMKGVLEKKHADINYHYIIEKVKEDYVPFVCRPFIYNCEWDDINIDVAESSIHIALLGNYDFTIPEKRLYEVLAFRLVNPMLKMFSLSPSRIKFHNEVSKNKDLSCPGFFVNYEVVISMVKRFVIK